MSTDDFSKLYTQVYNRLPWRMRVALYLAKLRGLVATRIYGELLEEVRVKGPPIRFHTTLGLWVFEPVRVVLRRSKTQRFTVKIENGWRLMRAPIEVPAVGIVEASSAVSASNEILAGMALSGLLSNAVAKATGIPPHLTTGESPNEHPPRG